jgi:hypothetical protein
LAKVLVHQTILLVFHKPYLVGGRVNEDDFWFRPISSKDEVLDAPRGSCVTKPDSEPVHHQALLRAQLTKSGFVFIGDESL